jgi:hypothetical protein
MEKVLDVKLSTNEAERIESAIKECDKSIRKIVRKMEKDQIEIERLKAETRQLLAEMKAA